MYTKIALFVNNSLVFFRFPVFTNIVQETDQYLFNGCFNFVSEGNKTLIPFVFCHPVITGKTGKT